MRSAIFTDLDVLAADAFDRTATKCAEGARHHRQDAEHIGDTPAKRDADPIFDRLTARYQAGAFIPDAKVSADRPQPGIVGKIAEHYRQCVPIEAGIDICDDDDVSGADLKP